MNYSVTDGKDRLQRLLFPDPELFVSLHETYTFWLILTTDLMGRCIMNFPLKIYSSSEPSFAKSSHMEVQQLTPLFESLESIYLYPLISFIFIQDKYMFPCFYKFRSSSTNHEKFIELCFELSAWLESEIL